MADLTVSKTEAIQERDSARRALKGLRAAAREAANTAVDAALSVGSAGAAGYAREKYGDEYQLLGYDASMVVGGATLALGMYQGGSTGERLIAAGVGMLCEFAAREGAAYAADQQADQPATQGGDAADYLRRYAGQTP